NGVVTMPMDHLEDKIHDIFKANTDLADAGLKVSDGRKEIMSLQIQQHLRTLLSASMFIGDVSALKCVNSKYLSTFTDKLVKAEDLLDEAEKAPAQDKFEKYMGAAQAFAEIGVPDGVNRSLQPLKEIADNPNVPTQTRASLWMAMSQIYTIAGMKYGV